MDRFESSEYKRARKAYVVQITMEYLVTLLVTDAFLASLLSNIGVKDSLIGIISSFVTLSFVIQLLSIFIMQFKVNSKKLVMIWDTISIFFFMFIYLIPALPIGKTLKVVLVIVSILIAYLGKYLILNICFKWTNSFVAADKRARFSANKEMISLVTGMVFSIVVGYIIDRFEDINNISGGFLFLASTILSINIVNFVSLSLIKREEEVFEEKKEHTESFWQVIKKIVANEKFRSVIWLTVMWDIARYLTVGFLGIFKYKDLAMSVFLVQIVNITANMMRILVSKPIARYSDKNSYAKGFRLGLSLAATAFLINMFTTKATWFLIVVYTIFFNCSIAGTNQNSYNIVYSYVDSKYIVQAMAVKNCLGGLAGFGASLLGGALLNMIQANNNMVFGIHIFGQQVLSGVSFVLTLITIIYTIKVVEKQKIMIQ